MSLVIYWFAYPIRDLSSAALRCRNLRFTVFFLSFFTFSYVMWTRFLCILSFLCVYDWMSHTVVCEFRWQFFSFVVFFIDKKKTLPIIYVVLFNFMHFYWAHFIRLAGRAWHFGFSVFTTFFVFVHTPRSTHSFIHSICFICILIALHPLFYVYIVKTSSMTIFVQNTCVSNMYNVYIIQVYFCVWVLCWLLYLSSFLLIRTHLSWPPTSIIRLSHFSSSCFECALLECLCH